MSNIAVHFGGGALGRGMVIPVLKDSGYEVVLVDTDQDLIDQLQHDGKYELHFTDNQQVPCQTINLHQSLSSINDRESLHYWLDQAKVISTSVRRENLSKVASILVEEAINNKIILGAENIERVSEVLMSELAQAALEKNINFQPDNIIAPDTMVDRICTSDWPDNTDIYTESFYEFTLSEKHDQISGVNFTTNIEAAFMRKRLLLNTYADISAFFALSTNLTYLHESINDNSIQESIKPFISLTHDILIQRWDFSQQELLYFQKLYLQRLQNSKLNRKIESVARNLWAKLTKDERFAFPLIQALESNISIDEAMKTLLEMIKISTNESDQQIKTNLQTIWEGSPESEKLYNVASRYLN